MITKIGDFLRKLRLDNQQILKDMAKVLGVSSAFLSAVENGKKSMPDSWCNILKESYKLSDDDVDNLRQAAMESQKSISLNLQSASPSNRQLAVSFARQFDSMDADTSQKILRILRDRKKDGRIWISSSSEK